MNALPRRAVAQYLRMSTEMQTCSLQYQAAANAAFAEAEGWRIVRTFADPGMSGLSLNARPGLKALLSDILGGQSEYDAVLVYDVSRWGRFQDLDQAAHYEFVCREAGAEVIYTGEPFSRDGSMVSAILKNLKRVMAAESVASSRQRRGARNACFRRRATGWAAHPDSGSAASA